MPEKHRIFVAIDLPEDTKQQLYTLQQNLHEQFVHATDEKTADNIARWTPPHNLHITLSFLGPINEEQTEAVNIAVTDVAARYTPFSVSITQTILAPPGNNRKLPRMVWADISRTDTLMQLQADIEDAIYSREEFAHKEREQRPFRPHLTLARFRKWQLKRIEREELPNVEGGVDIAFPVSAVDVMQSTLKRSGAEYTTVASHPLGNE